MIRSPAFAKSLPFSRQQFGVALVMLSGAWALLMLCDFYFSVVAFDSTRGTAESFLTLENGLIATATLLTLGLGILLVADISWGRSSEAEPFEPARDYTIAKPTGRPRVKSTKADSARAPEDTVSLDPSDIPSEAILPPDTPGQLSSMEKRTRIKRRVRVRIPDEKKR